jgi:alpha-1,2-mannosyltransferase
MIVGVFSPSINLCGGAEWVALSVMKTLKEHGHEVILLSDSPINKQKIASVFKTTVSVDREVTFPLRFFSPSNYHNLYTNVLEALMLKLKCKVLIDPHSNAILPGVDAVYIHYPLLKSVKQGLPYWRNKVYFLPYEAFLTSRRNNLTNKLIFANSHFTAKAVKAELGVDPYLLYPPVSNYILKHSESDLEKHRDNNVITVARIAAEKNLEIIPRIAKLTKHEISFTIVGLLSSKKVLNSLLNLIKELGVSKRVKVLTNLTREQSRWILLNSKVFLHTKEEEHFGIAIVEAMCLGCIPVVHDSGGPREFVPQRFRFDRIETAASKVEKAIDYWSPQRAKNISKIGERFSENNFSKNLIKIFDSHFHVDA